MQRREFISVLGGAAAWPLAARAQQPVMPVIGLMHATAAPDGDIVAGIKRGLSETGYVHGVNVTVEYRSAEGRYDRLPAIAADFVQRHVAVIVAGTPVAALAAKRATTSIPIVFVVGSDPVRDGLVGSLSSPGGNITGATFFSNLLTGKRLGLLHELVPNARAFGGLVNPKNANAQFQINEAEQAARTLGLPISFVNAASETEIDNAFNQFRQQQADALLILSDSFLNTHAHQIAKLAIQQAFPTCFAYREPTLAGGLMGYGASIIDAMRQSGVYAGRILMGEKPADLPVQQPTKFEFVINMKTAKAIGLAVPYSMQLLADEVIE
jgi:putative ABC transport system substrate-binding protein